MKIQHFLPLIAFPLIIFLQNCTVEHEFIFRSEFEFQIASDSSTFSDTVDVDVAKTSLDFDEHKDQLSAVEIQQISCTIDNKRASLSQKLLGANLAVSDTILLKPTVFLALQRLDLKFVGPRKVDVTLDDCNCRELEKVIIQPPHITRFYLSGSAQEDTLKFNVTMTFMLKGYYDEGFM